MDLGCLLLLVAGGVGREGGPVLVERTPCLDCVRWPLMVSSLVGQYLDALVYMRPGQVEKLLALIAASQVDLTENTVAAWR